MIRGKVTQQPEIERIVLVAEEATRAVVSALPYVKGDAGDDDAGGSGHGPETGLAPPRLTAK
jgi:hypothetical protein